MEALFKSYREKIKNMQKFGYSFAISQFLQIFEIWKLGFPVVVLESITYLPKKLGLSDLLQKLVN